MNGRNSRRDIAPVAITTQTAATRTYVDMSLYAISIVQLAYNATFDGTIKVYGSLQSTQPDVTVAVSQTNEFFPLALARMDTAALVPGATGIVVAPGSAGCVAFEPQADLIKWLCIEVTRTAGSYDMTYMHSNNL